MSGTAGEPTSTGISVVVPVLDDRVGMAELLAALAVQTRPPDEVVVVDGGSTDGTLEALSGWTDYPLKVLIEPGASIAAARNAGVRAAANEWIACTDAGCRPVPGWLAAIDLARTSADFVAGVLVVEGKSSFERVMALTHYPVAEELVSPAWLVRLSHSVFGRRAEPRRVGGGYMSFARSAWQAVDGFPEGLRYSDDRAFSAAIAERGLRIARAPDAAVRWRPPSTWRATAAQFFRYARGDVHIRGQGRHAVRAAAWVSACCVTARGGRGGTMLVGTGALCYCALPAWRAWRTGIQLREWWRIPVAVAVKDLSQLAGAATGLVDRVTSPGYGSSRSDSASDATNASTSASAALASSS